MFLFQTSLVQGAQPQLDALLKGVPADALQRLSLRGLTAEDRTLLGAKQKEMLIASGNSAGLLSALSAACKDSSAGTEYRQVAAYLYGLSASALEYRQIEVSKSGVKSVLKTDVMKASFETQFGDRELAKIAVYGAEEQISTGLLFNAGAQKEKGSVFLGDLPKSVPISTSFGDTKVYFDYSPQTINPPGIKLSATLPLNIDFSFGTPGASTFSKIYQFYQQNLSTTTYASLESRKADYVPLVDAWLNDKFNSSGTEKVKDVLSRELKAGHTVDEFIALFKNFRTAEAFSLLRSDEGYNKLYTSFGVGKMEYKSLVTNAVQSEFAKRASGKISGQTSVTVDLSKRFSLLGYFDYNNVSVKAVEELPGQRVRFYDAGGLLLFHAKNIVLDAGAGYQWGKANANDILTIPLNAFYVRADARKTIPVSHLFKMALEGTFTQTFFEGGNAFSSARVGAKVSKPIPIKSMDLDIYVNPFADLDLNQGKLSKDFTIRTGIDLKKIPIPKGFMTVGAYYDFLKKDVGGVRITYHF